MIRRAFAAVAGIALALSIPLASSAAPQFIMKMGTASINDHQHEWLKRFKAAVEKDSNGRIEVDVYPAAQLGSIPREIEDTQFNAIQGWDGPPDFLSGIDARFSLLNAPGLFATFKQASESVQDPQVEKIFQNLAIDKGFIVVSMFVSDRQALITRKPIRSLDDIKGLKIRVTAGPIQERSIRAFGATPIAMPLDSVLTALQQGAIDGQTSTLAVLTPLKYYSVSPYLLPFGHTYVTDVAIISRQFFETLPPDLKKIVMDDGFKTGKTITSFVDTYRAENRKAWVAGGGSLETLLPAEVKTMDDLLRPIAADIGTSTPDMKAVYDQLTAAAARNQ
jgi:TRAP-type C4-dicarboxylate transport system substrate-binding protein